MDNKELINQIKQEFIEKLTNLVLTYGFNDVSNNKFDNGIPLCDGGKKYDGFYINGFKPYGCVYSDRRKLVSIYLYKLRDGSGYMVGFVCDDGDGDLSADDLYIEQLADIIDFVEELVNKKEDYDACHIWYLSGEEE